MVQFSSTLPVATNRVADDGNSPLDLDVIGWEIFRQLLSPRIDPLNSDTVSLLQRLVRARSAEIEALSRKCFLLAQELSGESNLDRLQRRIADYIRARVAKTVETLLFADKAAANEFLDSVFADQQAWVGLATFLYSLSHGGPLVTASAAIATLASVGPKAMKAASERRKKLEGSDYTLIYRVNKARRSR